MKSRTFPFAVFLLVIIPLCSAETVSIVLGEQYNFTLNESKYIIALVGLSQESATFTVSGRIASVHIGEIKTLGLRNASIGDVSIGLNSIMPDSSVEFNLTSPKSGEKVCTQINESCSDFNECCAGNCIVGMCRYVATINANPNMNVSLDVPVNVTVGGTVRLKITGEDGNPVGDVTVDVITPFHERLTLATNESGEGFYIANQEGVYSYVIYNYVLNSSKTTLSFRPAAPTPVNNTPPEEKPKEPFCGDGTCNSTENCSNCQQDCGICVTLPPSTETPKPQEPAYSWVMWMSLMFLAIIVILRVVLPVFVKSD